MDQGQVGEERRLEEQGEVKRHHNYKNGNWVNRKFKGKRRKRGRPRKRKSYLDKKRRWRSKLTEERRLELAPYVVVPEGTSRSGTPDGMSRAQAMEEWALAREKADWLMTKLEEAEVISFDPNISEEEMARGALKEAFAIVMSPMSGPIKMAAIRTVLEWTKAKPATKTDLKLSTAETWLQEVVVDHQRSLPSPSEAPALNGLQVLGEALREDTN